MQVMKLKSPLIILLLLVFAVELAAVPARRGVYTCLQPDGSSFQVTLSGDEFGKLVSTLDGCAVIMDESGYYCYAYMDDEGHLRSSEIPVRRANGFTPAAAASREVSLKDIRNKNMDRRQRTDRSRMPVASPATKSASASVKKKNIIILAEFCDLKFKYKRDYFVKMLTEKGYSSYGATGCALDYFKDQLGEIYDFDFIISPVVTLSMSYSYYGANEGESIDVNAPAMVVEACRLASAAGVDFSMGDGDNDGQVDNVFIFTAGLSEAEHASDNYIWPHSWTLEDAGVSCSINGKKINTYSVATEQVRDNSNNWRLATIGTFCHEYSHSLGLSDHYDTDKENSGGDSGCSVWGATDLMNYGNYNNDGNTPPNFNAPELETLGAGHVIHMDEGSYRLTSASPGKEYMRYDTDKKGEYFIFEYRSASGWDKYIGGSGMLVYHIDKSNNPAGYSDYWRTPLTAEERWWYNEVNCNPEHLCFDLVKAIPDAGDESQVFWPNGAHDSFTPSGKPSFMFWSGKYPDISIIGIRKEADGVSFTAAGPLSLEKVEEFQDAAIVLWTSTGNSEKSSISIQDPAGSTHTHVVAPYAGGRYTYTFEGLKPKTTYKVIISGADGSGSVISTEFTTKAYYTDGYPFIYLNSASRNADGSFPRGAKLPLRVFNAQNTVKVTWQFNSSTLLDDGSGYYTVAGDGTIKATLEYKDGTREIISKTIKVK